MGVHAMEFAAVAKRGMGYDSRLVLPMLSDQKINVRLRMIRLTGQLPDNISNSGP